MDLFIDLQFYKLRRTTHTHINMYNVSISHAYSCVFSKFQRRKENEFMFPVSEEIIAFNIVMCVRSYRWYRYAWCSCVCVVYEWAKTWTFKNKHCAVRVKKENENRMVNHFNAINVKVFLCCHFRGSDLVSYYFLVFDMACNICDSFKNTNAYTRDCW